MEEQDAAQESKVGEGAGGRFMRDERTAAEEAEKIKRNEAGEQTEVEDDCEWAEMGNGIR